MNNLTLPLMLCSLLILSACSDSNTAPVDTDNTGEIEAMEGTTDNTNQESEVATASYRITFNGTWSAATHPTQFPGNAHFSGLVGAVHNDQVTFWEPGQIASDGIELMAETGSKAIFLEEINSAIDSGYAIAAIDGPGIASSPGVASVEVDVSVDNPLVTLTTMIAPSPDWFVGFHGVRLYENGEFIDSLTVDGFAYDSGTDSGVGYTSGNNDTQPRDIIIRTTSEASDSSFVQGLPIAGQFVIEKMQGYPQPI